MICQICVHILFLLPSSGQKNLLLEVYKCISMDLCIPIFTLFSDILLNDKSYERKQIGG